MVAGTDGENIGGGVEVRFNATCLTGPDEVPMKDEVAKRGCRRDEIGHISEGAGRPGLPKSVSSSD